MEREWKQYSQSVLRNVVSKNCQFVMLLDPLETQWMQSAQINCEAILKMHLWLQLLDCCCMLTVVICVMVGGPNWLMMLLHSIKWVFIYMWKLVFLYFCNAFSVISFFCQKSKLLKIYRIQSLVSACKQNRVSFIMYLHRRNWGDSEHADIENRALAAWSTAFQYQNEGDMGTLTLPQNTRRRWLLSCSLCCPAPFGRLQNPALLPADWFRKKWASIKKSLHLWFFFFLIVVAISLLVCVAAPGYQKVWRNKKG